VSNIEREPHPAPRSAEERERILQNPGFGAVFTDHMVTIEWKSGSWGPTRIRPFQNLSLSPAAMVLHYGQAVFEGLKAYRQPDGSVATFRPEANAARFNRSGARLAMPPLDESRFVQAVDELVRADKAWVPAGADSSLYLRPIMFATESALGVRPANEYLFLLFASPAGSYFAGGVKPVNVWLSFDTARAAEGGTGAAKCAGNYAGTLVPQAAAAKEGCSQVLYLDGREHKYVEEMGGMNVFFALKEGSRTVLVTPDLSRKTLLAGITRDSVITLAKDAGFEVQERRFSVDEWVAAMAEGRLLEAFACGTAAVITPIGCIRSERGEWKINGGEPGKVATDLRARLVDIQFGRAADAHGWRHRID
jgi:branched-chain amino acid aminotransferase